MVLKLGQLAVLGPLNCLLSVDEAHPTLRLEKGNFQIQYLCGIVSKRWSSFNDTYYPLSQLFCSLAPVICLILSQLWLTRLDSRFTNLQSSALLNQCMLHASEVSHS